MNKRKIQLIDDEPDVILYLSSFLEDNGYEVRSAHDAEKGLEMIKDERPDLVLLDVMMPGDSGLNFLISLRSQSEYADLPVVLVTGSEKIRERDFGSFLKGYGAKPPDGIVEKPIDPRGLLTMIEQFFEGEEDEGYASGGQES